MLNWPGISYKTVLSPNNKFGALLITRDHLIPYYLCKCANHLASKKFLACENSRFSSLLATWDVQRKETSAPKRQKFHTDYVESVRTGQEL